MAYPYKFDFLAPDYAGVFRWRRDNLIKIRNRPNIIPALKLYYRSNPVDFIEDWGCTFDPRLVGTRYPATIPLMLFPRQKKFLGWVLERMAAQEFGNAPKSRDMGLTWMLAALFSTLCLFNNDFVAGFGSRKEILVDRAGDPDSIFFKVRMFLALLPKEFNGGWRDGLQGSDKYMLIKIPETGSVIRGEAGDNIGRGGRATIYGVDEAAFIDRAQKVDAALSQNTRCVIKISSVNGLENPFAEQCHAWPARRVFYFHWRDDPRKDDAWYRRQCDNLNSLIVAQEIDLDWSASRTGVIIPSSWVQSAIGAARRLALPVDGQKIAALDVADEGLDLNAWGYRHGIEVKHIEAWSGQGKSIFWTAERAVMLADAHDVGLTRYDADGLGAGIRGDVAQINTRPDRVNSRRDFVPFRGSGEVMDKERPAFKGDGIGIGVRTNGDYYQNLKAQSWMGLRARFEKTHLAITEGRQYPSDELISISEEINPETRTKLMAELSRAVYDINNGNGKLFVDKTPEGQRSPNMADAIMMMYAPQPQMDGMFKLMMDKYGK